MTASTPHILVVEDGHQIGMLVAKYLRTNEYRVTTAKDAREMHCAVCQPDRPLGARSQPAWRGWTEHLQTFTGSRLPDTDRHADSQGRGDRSHCRTRNGSSRLSAQAVQPARITCTDQVGVAAPAAGSRIDWRCKSPGLFLRRMAAQRDRTRAFESTRGEGYSHRCGVRLVARVLRASWARSFARPASRSDARPLRGALRTFHRRAGQPSAPQNRS